MNQLFAFLFALGAIWSFFSGNLAEGAALAAATVSTDFVFEPKVWKDHISAYFDDKLLFGALAERDDTLTSQPGETINFPYFEQVGAVEEPAETAALSVDNLSDNSFSATVKEVGKAVGVKKKAFKVSAARTERVIQEITSQMGRRHAEKIDDDLLAEFSTGGNFQDAGNVGAGATVQKVNTGKVTAFGDKHTDAIALQMHSLDLLALRNDTTAGFLHADATDPMFGKAGFQGRLLGMAVFETDKVTQTEAWVHKAAPYGFIVKQDMELEADYDILNREWIFASNEWYAVKSFHAKINSLDYKTGKMTFA